MDMDDSGDLYCFGRGRMDVKCYDDHMGGYGSGSMGYGSGPMGSGYGSGSMGYGSGSMGSGNGMGSGMESGYGYGSEGYGPGGYGSDFSSTSTSSYAKRSDKDPLPTCKTNPISKTQCLHNKHWDLVKP